MSVAAAALSEPALSSDQELRSAVDDRELPADPGRSRRSSGQDREGTGRVGEEESGQVELRLDLAGLHHRDRTAQAQERHAGHHDPLQEQQRDDPERHAGPDPAGDLRRPAGDADDQGRQGARRSRSPARSAPPELPDVPSMAEAGFPEVNTKLWSGFFAARQHAAGDRRQARGRRCARRSPIRACPTSSRAWR